MIVLTDRERKLVRSSCHRGTSPLRRTWASAVGCVMACIGAAMIVGGSAWQWRCGDIDGSSFRKTLGFSLVLVACVGSTWASERKARVARSAIAKLYRASRCPHCGAELIEADNVAEP